MNFEDIKDLKDFNQWLDTVSADEVMEELIEPIASPNWDCVHAYMELIYPKADLKKDLEFNSFNSPVKDNILDINKYVKLILNSTDATPEEIKTDLCINFENDWDVCASYWGVQNDLFADADLTDVYQDVEKYLLKQGVELNLMEDFPSFGLQEILDYHSSKIIWAISNCTQIQWDDMQNYYQLIEEQPIHFILPIDAEYEDLSDPNNDFAKQFKDLEGPEFNVDNPGILFSCTLSELIDLKQDVDKGNTIMQINSNNLELYVPKCGYSGGEYLQPKSEKVFYPIGNLNNMELVCDEEATYGLDLLIKNIDGIENKQEFLNNLQVTNKTTIKM